MKFDQKKVVVTGAGSRIGRNLVLELLHVLVGSCGVGQIYNRQYEKGIALFVLCVLLWFVLLGWVFHIWSIIDAGVVGRKRAKKSKDGDMGDARSADGVVY